MKRNLITLAAALALATTAHAGGNTGPSNNNGPTFGGNTTNTGTKKFTFLDRIPKGRLLCERCEANAWAHEQPSAESIMKKHVHLGRVVAQQTCCATKGDTP